MLNTQSNPLGIQRGIDWSRVAGINDVLDGREWRELLPSHREAVEA